RAFCNNIPTAPFYIVFPSNSFVIRLRRNGHGTIREKLDFRLGGRGDVPITVLLDSHHRLGVALVVEVIDVGRAKNRRSDER
ncbi:MAG: hypothetical protein ACOYEF_09000, partial [Planifilum sp.]